MNGEKTLDPSFQRLRVQSAAAFIIDCKSNWPKGGRRGRVSLDTRVGGGSKGGQFVEEDRVNKGERGKGVGAELTGDCRVDKKPQ